MKYLFIRALYRIKAHHPKTWAVIEYINSMLFGIFYLKSFKRRLQSLLNDQRANSYQFRFLHPEDKYALQKLVAFLDPEYRKYFEPHGFNEKNLRRQFKNKALIKMGVFHQNQLVGYFFIRAGINKKCFVGRLIHKDFRNKGIGSKMSQIMYQSAFSAGFRIFATLSPNNKLVMQSHKNNPNIRILHDLPDNYQLVEFVKK